MSHRLMVTQIIGHSSVCSTVRWGPASKKHQRSALLALCEGNPPVTGGFPSQRASYAGSASMSWRHRRFALCLLCCGLSTVDFTSSSVIPCQCRNPEEYGYKDQTNPLGTDHKITAKRSTTKLCSYIMYVWVFCWLYPALNKVYFITCPCLAVQWWSITATFMCDMAW